MLQYPQAAKFSRFTVVVDQQRARQRVSTGSHQHWIILTNIYAHVLML